MVLITPSTRWPLCAAAGILRHPATGGHKVALCAAAGMVNTTTEWPKNDVNPRNWEYLNCNISNGTKYPC